VSAAILFLIAAILARLACSPVAHLARRWGIVSAPSRDRAGSGRVPLLGGVAVLAGLAGGWVASVLLADTGMRQPGGWWLPIGLAVGFGAIGGVDDRRGLDPALRLLLEIFGASIALRLACAAPGIACPFGGLPILGGALVVTAAANAFNLTDNADGLAAGTGALTLLGLACWPVPGEPRALGIAAAGGLAGFWMVNRPPARIYLGDLGSLAIGGLMGLGLWQRWMFPPPGRSSLAIVLAGALILGYTLFDPAYAVLRRLARRRAPWIGGVDHPSHDLAALFPGWGRALAILLLAQALSVAAGLAIAVAGAPPVVALVGIAIWVGIFVAARAGARRRSRAGIGPVLVG
jgi:UDP-GlcNAc:undecaprenyl-phosphate GlcNAc-1-phosphate transferase